MRKHVIFTILITQSIFSFLFLQISIASAQSNTFNCVWRPDVDPAACVAAPDCTEGFVPNDVCYNRPMESCYEEGIPCVKSQGKTGFWCINDTCELCDTSLPGCYPHTESECGLYCYTGGGFTYNCDKPSSSCEKIKGGGGEYLTEGDCFRQCGATSNKITCETSDGMRGINSAIGCIPIEASTDFLKFLLLWAIGVTSGIAILMIIYSGFLIITSSGDSRKLQAGKELLISVLTGIALLILSAYLIRIIGWDILKLPEFPHG